MKTILAAVAAVALSAGAGSASTVGFHFGAGSPSQSGYYESAISQTKSGLSLTVTGMRCDDGKGPNDSSCSAVGGLGEWDNGIGLKKFNSGDSHKVDGAYSNEFLKLTFGKEVSLAKLAFSYFGSNDKFRLYSWSGSAWDYEGKGTSAVTYLASGVYTGSMFLLGATGDHDAWKFKGVHAEVSPVPLPAAGWMLLAGLGGIAAMKRRKTS
ncbi:MAG: VPLPA-CTERM sorting domain-containing protein [Pseudomonadota bacterium]